MDTRTCRWCDGKGQCMGYPCADCEGTGLVGGLRAKAELDRQWNDIILRHSDSIQEDEYMRQIMEGE